METGLIVSLVLAGVGGLVWLIRLEGRINLNERVTNDLAEDVKEIKADVKTLLQRR